MSDINEQNDVNGKSDNMKSIIKKQNELLTKEREYLKMIENLQVKIKNLEKSNKSEIDKLTTENNEKENRINILQATNGKMKQSYELLTKRIEKLQKDMESKSAKNKNEGAKKDDTNKKGENPEMEQKLADIDKEIKQKQNLINILSKKNQDIKKSIDSFYQLTANKNILNELKEKEFQKKKLEEEVKEYEKIVNKHNSQCVTTIENLKKELEKIKSQLNVEKNEFHNKNQDYIMLQCKFSLSNKEKEEEYLKLKNKKNFLDMNKHKDLMGSYNLQRLENIKMYNKRKEFGQNIEKGNIQKYERSPSLPKIDNNNEKKVISSLFTNDELILLKNIFLDDYQDENLCGEFMNKIKELEKGKSTDEETYENLKKENAELEKQSRENVELIKMEHIRLKEKKKEIANLNKDYKIQLRKNIQLKKEENKLKNDLKLKTKEKKINVERNERIKAITDMINEIKNIKYEDDNLTNIPICKIIEEKKNEKKEDKKVGKKDEPKNANINNKEIQNDNNEDEEQNLNNEGEEAEGEEGGEEEQNYNDDENYENNEEGENEEEYDEGEGNGEEAQ